RRVRLEAGPTADRHHTGFGLHTVAQRLALRQRFEVCGEMIATGDAIAVGRQRDFAERGTAERRDVHAKRTEQPHVAPAAHSVTHLPTFIDGNGKTEGASVKRRFQPDWSSPNDCNST